MFSIHNFREQWELMPTAISLKTVIDELKEDDSRKLSDLTGLSSNQVDRCKVLLSFSEKFQVMSLETDPDKRIPSNFWIESYPVIKIYENKLPELIKRLGRDTLIQKLVDKYNNKKITSIIHFRRIVEASEKSKAQNREKEFVKKLEEYINNIQLETRESFDDFLPPRNIRTAVNACDEFINKLKNLESELTVEIDEDFVKSLKKVQKYVIELLTKIDDGDKPKD